MDEELKTLAQSVARFEPAEDVADLDTARRLITALRERCDRLAAELEPDESPGVWTAFLDDEHDTMLVRLYDKQRLIGEPSDPYWLDPPDLIQAFGDFVHVSLDVAWDMANGEDAESFPLRYPRKKPALSA